MCTGSNLGYSLDGGKTWHNAGSAPDPKSSDGFIAVSADGKAWVWTPKGQQPHVSHDRGDTWTPVKGLPAGYQKDLQEDKEPVFDCADMPLQGLHNAANAMAALAMAEALELPLAPTLAYSNTEHLLRRTVR